MTLYNSERDGDVLRFNTDHLSYWAIVGEKTAVTTQMNNAIILVAPPILLAIATMGYALILLGKNRKKGAN